MNKYLQCLVFAFLAAVLLAYPSLLSAEDSIDQSNSHQFFSQKIMPAQAAESQGIATQDSDKLQIKPALNHETIVATSTGLPYRGNTKSRKFHRPGCRYYNCKNCTALFQTREEAINAGYVPCKVCNP